MHVADDTIGEWRAAAETSGVYKLIFPSGVYVGASFTVDQRVEGHLIELRAGTHSNRLLQHVFEREHEQLRVVKRFLPIVTDYELATFERVMLREVFVSLGGRAVLNKTFPQPVGRRHGGGDRRVG